MALPDIYSEGIASGWKVIDGAKLSAPQTLEADVAIIGSGAGGGVAAEIGRQPRKGFGNRGACVHRRSSARSRSAVTF